VTITNRREKLFYWYINLKPVFVDLVDFNLGRVVMSGRRLLFVLGAIVGLLLLFVPTGYALWAGVLILTLAALIWATFDHSEASRARWIFAAVFVPLLGIFAWYFEGRLHDIRPPAELETALLQRIFALSMGGFISFLLTTLFALITIFVASVYVLSINMVEDVPVLDAFRSLLTLIVGTQYDWIVVTYGEISNVKGRGIMKWLGGPGKIIIDPGSAAVLQRGGKVTQVVGPGVHHTIRNEKIRMAFDLRSQFAMQTFDAMTADRIPLMVEMGIVYRIKPAKNKDAPPKKAIDLRPDGVDPRVALQEIIADNARSYPVVGDTLVKAAFNNTSGTWKGLGGGAPTVQVKDHFMGYTLEELFELDDSEGVRPNARRIKKIEDEILRALNGFGSSKGIIWDGVDIREIKMPGEMMTSMMLEMKSGAEARAIRRITEERNRAQQQLIDDILATIARYKAEPLDETDIQLATVFVQLGRRGLTDDVLGHQYIDMLKSLANGQGAKIFSPPNMPFELKDLL
jgi:regulator of protease activity HflC (stomatin/prohibitin superfamily)